MTKKQMTTSDEYVLSAISAFFSEVGKFSITAEDFVDAEKARLGYCFLDSSEVVSYLEKALKIGFVSKDDSVFSLNLDDELVAEMIADRIKDKEVFVAQVDSDIRFLERYRQEKSKQ